MNTSPTSASGPKEKIKEPEPVSVSAALRGAFLRGTLIPALLFLFFAVAPAWLNHRIHSDVASKIEAEPGMNPLQREERLAFFSRLDFAALAREAPPDLAPLREQMRQAGMITHFQRLRLGFWASLVLLLLWLGATGGTLALNRQAAKSRAALITAYRRAWGLSLFASLAKVFLLVPLLGYGFFELTTLAFDRFFPQLILAVALGGVVALWRSGQILLRKVPLEFVEPMSRAVTPEEAPELWAVVRDAATRLRTAPPDHILVGMQLNFYVTELAVKHDGGRVEGRTLFLSQPMLKQLQPEEVLAIVGHELGHFIGDDTRLTREFYPLRFKALGTLGALSQSGWVGWTSLHALGFFHWCFGATEQAMSREREFAADRVGAELTRPEIAARALVKFQLFNEAYALGITGRGGVRLDRDAFEAPLADFVRERLLQDADFWERLLSRRTPHPLDSHPPLQERLVALGAGAAPADLQAQATLGGETAFSVWLGGRAELFAEQNRKASELVGKIQAQTEITGADYETAAGRELLEKHFPEVVWKARAFPIWLCLGLLGLFAACAVAVAIFAEITALRILFGLLGAGLGAAACAYWKTHRNGVYTLRADSINYTGWTRPLRFSDVEKTSVMNNHGTLVVTFRLKEKAPPIRRFSPLRYRRKTVQLSLGSIAGKQKEILETLYRYHTRQLKDA